MRDLVPPHSTEAEESLLGGILSDYNSVIDLILSINVSDFYSDRHACIFSGILELHNEGKQVNIVTVIEKLKQKNGLGEAGGAYYLTGLSESSPSSANLKSYINTIKELARKRKLIILGREIEDKVGSREDSEDIISHISGKIYDIDSSSDANLIYGSEILKRRREGLIERIKGCVIGTGYPSVDEKLGSGFAPKQGSIICGRPGVGKCLGKGTKVLMYDGSIKVVEELKVGDKLMGISSTPRTILNLDYGFDPMFQICPIKGEKWKANGNHILSLICSNDKNSFFKGGNVYNISINDYFNLPKRIKHGLKLYTHSVEFKEQNVKLEPYFMGIWLGDGRSDDCRITSADKEVASYLKRFAIRHNKKLTIYKSKGKASSYAVTNISTKDYRKNSVQSYLRKYKLLKNKHIPIVYKLNNKENRLDLLAGLLDSDGYLFEGRIYEYTSKSERLIDDVLFLSRSLGFSAFKYRKYIKYRGEIRLYYRTYISGDIWKIPTKIERKKAFKFDRRTDPKRIGFSIKSIGIGEYFGFELDKDGLFLLDNFVVTHNSAYKENLINNQCQQGYKILSIIPEMGFDAEMDRHTSILTGIPLMDISHIREWASIENGKFKTKNKEKLRQIRKAAKTISEWNLYFLDGHVALSDIYRRIIEVKRKHGLDIVYIDLFDRIEEVDRATTNKPQVIGKCLNFLERIQKEQDIHICNLVQISRKIESRKDKRPTMSDLKESGSFEEKAWMIMGMYREAMYNKDCFDDTIEMIMLKQRTGSYFSQKLNWDPETLYISEDSINAPF